jgi:acetyltransferase-like isoleucine patch superfamily enzyme
MLFADPSDRGGEIVIEDDVLIGAGVHFYTNNHKFSDTNAPIISQGYPDATPTDSIILKRGCWVGANVVILPGVEIGENSVVGAGTIVTKSVPSRVVFAGNPGKVIKSIES